MHKKATVKIAGEFIVWVAFLLLVILTFLGAAYKIKDNRLHELRVELIDYALTRNALIASPYPIDYKYKTNPEIELSLNEENCIVEAKIKGNPTISHRNSCATDQFTELHQQKSGTALNIKN